MKILTTWSDRNSIGYVVENDRGERKTGTKPFNWYFYIDRENYAKGKDLLKTFIVDFEIDPEMKDYFRVYVNDIYQDKVKIQDKYKVALTLEAGGVKTHEADLPNDKRWLLDNNYEIASKYKKLYIDIETDDTIRKLEVGRDRILSFGAVDSGGKKYFLRLPQFTDGSERIFLEKILDIISEYDIVLGWNLKGFDIPYLKIRMKALGVDMDKYYSVWRKTAVMDLLKRFRHIFRFDSGLKKFNLDYVSHHFLGRGKVEKTGKVIDMYRHDKEKLEEYNLEDAVLTKDLDEKLGVSDMMIRQSGWCGIPVIHFGLYSIIDSFILRTAHSVHKAGPTSVRAIQERSVKNTRTKENPDETDTGEAQYTGAEVLDPKVGKYKRVYSFDFKGLYPSMMRTSNIGYDTLRYDPGDLSEARIINPGTYTVPRSNGFRKPTYFIKTPSVINLAITKLIDKRTEYKKLKLKMIEEGTNSGPEWERVVSDEIIVKELANSTYGIMGLSYGRYYSVDIAESITLFGQWALRSAKQFFESLGYDVIYGDTDSIFVSTQKETLMIEEVLVKYHEFLRKELKDKYNIEENFIQLNFDKQYESFILVNKKNYVGQVINIEGKKTNQLHARGLDYLKRNTFKFAAKKQKELIEYFLHEKTTLDKAKGYMKKIRNEFLDTEFPKEDLVMVQRVGQTEYSKNIPAPVQLALRQQAVTGNEILHTEVDYIIVSQKPQLKAISPDEFTGTYDKEYYWDNRTLPALLRITDAVYPGEVLWDRQSSIFDLLDNTIK